MRVALASLFLLAAVLSHGAQDGTADGAVKISSFGYDPEDATRFLQAALDSGARKLVLDRQAGPWYTLPLKMRSNTELVLEPGVELVAKRGAYKGLRDFLLEQASVPVAIDLSRDGQTVAPRGRAPFPLYLEPPAGAPFALLATGDDYYRFGWTLTDPAGNVRAQADCVDGISFARSGEDAPRGLWRIDFRKGTKPVYDWICLDLFGTPAQLFLSPAKTWYARGADR